MEIKYIALVIETKDGHECIDNVGKIFKLFLKDNPATQLQFNNNNTSFSILNWSLNIENFVIGFNSIKVFIRYNEYTKTEMQYSINKINQISSMIDLTCINKISIQSRFLFTETDELTHQFREKLFLAKHIKYFSLVLNQVNSDCDQDIRFDTKIYTGQETTTNIVQSQIQQLQFTIQQQKKDVGTNYYFDNDVYYSSAQENFNITSSIALIEKLYDFNILNWSNFMKLIFKNMNIE